MTGFNDIHQRNDFMAELIAQNKRLTEQLAENETLIRSLFRQLNELENIRETLAQDAPAFLVISKEDMTNLPTQADAVAAARELAHEGVDASVYQCVCRIDAEDEAEDEDAISLLPSVVNSGWLHNRCMV